MRPTLQFFHVINHMMCCKHVISAAWNSLTFSALSYNTCQHLGTGALHRTIPTGEGSCRVTFCGAGREKRSEREHENRNGAVMKREGNQILSILY